jgi:succinate-semialdehyde dehydrogenase/glutarate-semialdehyde dehydrogenase
VSTSQLLDSVPKGLFIGGSWRPASDGNIFDVVNPATEEPIASVSSANDADAIAAVDAAAAALGDWGKASPRRRADVLRRAFELMIARADELALLITLENGKALSDSKAEIRYAAEFFRWYSEEAVRLVGSMQHAPSGDYRILVQHQPIGVAVLITPWNYPAAMATRKIGPALAAARWS